MKEAVPVIASFNKLGDAVPLYVQLTKGDKTLDLKITESIKAASMQNRYVSYRCRSPFHGREVEYALDFYKGTTVWYITISNSTFDGLFK